MQINTERYQIFIYLSKFRVKQQNLLKPYNRPYYTMLMLPSILIG